MSFFVFNHLWNKQTRETLTHITLDSVLVDWHRMQKMIVCDNATAAMKADYSKDTYQSVAFLRYGFNYDNPSELYVCKSLKKSNQYVIQRLVNGDAMSSKPSEQVSDTESPFRRSKREKKKVNPPDETPEWPQ